MKIAIAGSGKIGTAIAEQLVKENHDITVIDKSEENISFVSNSLDVLPIVGDAASAQVLIDAGVDKCDLLIAVTDSDESNLLICVVAKKLGVNNTIARIRNPIFAETVQIIKEEMGLSFITNPERDTATEIIKSLSIKAAGQIETFAKGNNEVITFVVKEGNPVCGMMIKDMGKYLKHKVLICAVKRNEQIFIPNGNVTIEKGDVLSIVSSREDATVFFKKMGYETKRIRDLTIIGGSKIAYYLTALALKEDILVKIIEKDEARCLYLNYEFPEATVLCGDATDTSLLEENGVLESSAVITATGADETNILTSMYIAKKSPDTKVITVINSADYLEMLSGIEVGNVFNPKFIAADRITTYVRAMQETAGNDVQSLCHVIENKVEVLEFEIKSDAPHIGEPLSGIKFKENLLIASITRNGNSFIPGGNDTVETGDTVIVVTTKKGIGKFGEIFA